MGTIIVNGKSYEMRTETTTLADFKKVIRSVANARKIAQKDIEIVLTNGKKISFKEIDTFKEMVYEQNAGTYMGRNIDDSCRELSEKLDNLTTYAYQTPLKFGQIGSNSEESFKEIADNTFNRLLQDGTITDAHIKLIG